MWAAVIAFFVKELTVEGLKALLLRALIASAIGVLLPICLYNIYCLILGELLTWAASRLGDVDIPDAALQLTGMAAWLVSKLKIAESMSMYMSAMIAKMTIDFIMRRTGIL